MRGCFNQRCRHKDWKNLPTDCTAAPLEPRCLFYPFSRGVISVFSGMAPAGCINVWTREWLLGPRQSCIDAKGDELTNLDFREIGVLRVKKVISLNRNDGVGNA